MAQGILYEKLRISGLPRNCRTIFGGGGDGVYVDIKILSGRVIRVWYSWDVGGEVLSASKDMKVPIGLGEEHVMSFIKAMLES